MPHTQHITKFILGLKYAPILLKRIALTVGASFGRTLPLTRAVSRAVSIMYHVASASRPKSEADICALFGLCPMTTDPIEALAKSIYTIFFHSN